MTFPKRHSSTRWSTTQSSSRTSGDTSPGQAMSTSTCLRATAAAVTASPDPCRIVPDVRAVAVQVHVQFGYAWATGVRACVRRGLFGVYLRRASSIASPSVCPPQEQSSEHCLEQSACLVEWLFHWHGVVVVAPAGQSLTQAHRADSYAPSRPPRPTPTSTPHGTPIGIANTRRLGGIQVQVLQLPATEASRAGMCAANHGRRVCMATRLWA